MGHAFLAETKRILTDRTLQAAAGHGMVPAAVLLALYQADGDFRVVLQKRSEWVEHHKGEISFPGGMVDPGDRSRLDAALREAHEEMGIAPDDVEVLGQLDDTPTITRFMITTFVGAIPSPYTFSPSAAEVEGVLQVPLSHLRDPSSRRAEARVADGRLVSMPTFVHNGHVIFGATARILDQFLELTGDIPL